MSCACPRRGDLNRCRRLAMSSAALGRSISTSPIHTARPIQGVIAMATKGTTYPTPQIVDRSALQSELDQLLVREKAHTREGDAIAAARRRLPMVEVDAATPVVGADGEVPLVDVFEGRKQLIAYFHMWHEGKPAAEQCEGCTFFTGHAQELSYLHSRDVTYATFCQGPYAESARYRDFMGWEMPWYSLTEATDLLAGRSVGFYA